MTRVPPSAERAEATATEQERRREAWSPPRQSRAKAANTSPDSHELGPCDEVGTHPSRTTVPALAIARADHHATVRDLDWEGFLAAYSPGSCCHDLEAITAYGAYKRSRAVDEQSAIQASRSQAERIPTAATAVEAWEDEGGASQ